VQETAGARDVSQEVIFVMPLEVDMLTKIERREKRQKRIDEMTK